MNPHRHNCWWSGRKMCEIRYDTTQQQLSGAGIDSFILELGSTYASGQFSAVPEDEENTNLSIVLPEGVSPNKVLGGIHDDCFFSLQPVTDGFSAAICRAVLEQQVGYANLQVDLQDAPSKLVQVLREYGCLRLRTDTKKRHISVEIVKSDSWFFWTRHRPIGQIRLDQPQARLEIF